MSSGSVAGWGVGIPSVSAEAVRDAFIADATADTELVVRVSELLSTSGELKERVEATDTDVVYSYTATESRPNAAANRDGFHKISAGG